MSDGTSPFGNTATIYKDRDVLRPDYQPEELIERDEEINKYASALEPVLHGWAPDNIFIYGKAGTGKTATTNYMINWLQHDAEANEESEDVTIVNINCDGLTSSYRVAVEIVNTLRDDKAQIPPAGHSKTTVYNWMYEEFNELGGIILVVLDEIDHIDNDDSILYQLARCESMGKLENGRLGIIGISNDFSFRDSLSAKVKDSLCEKEIMFPSYESGELRRILVDRAEESLYDDAYDQSAIALSAAFAAQDKGSARQAIDILRNAADLANANGDDKVSDDHVRDAKEHVERGRVEDMIDSLSPQGKYVVQAIAIAERDNQTPIRTKNFYSLYKKVANSEGSESLSGRSVRDHLSELDMIGLLTSERKNEGLSNGAYKMHELDVSLDSVLSYFESTENER